jgi:hypothetical protein
VLALLTVPVTAQHPSMPSGMTHEEHLAQMQKDTEMKRRGAEAMGFDQSAVVHHFVLSRRGGFIEVEARDAADAKNIAAIRSHLREIADEFGQGHFQAPSATHGEVPPGVPTLQRLHPAVSYTYVETTAGGGVAISTTDADAVKAVHEFLRYQIREHHTSDSEAIK